MNHFLRQLNRLIESSGRLNPVLGGLKVFKLEEGLLSSSLEPRAPERLGQNSVQPTTAGTTTQSRRRRPLS